MKRVVFILLSSFAVFLSCTDDEMVADEENILRDEGAIAVGQEEMVLENNKRSFKILALGDSYTIGSSVCETCNFPSQLKSALQSKFGDNTAIELQILATNGWTTTNLLSAIMSSDLPVDYDLVTLLIGVNNQYQNKRFSIYENEFVELVAKAIRAVGNNEDRLVVLSIPDYAYTPFGGQEESISRDIDRYNDFAKQYCSNNEITFLNITDITREGIKNPDLVARDQLHPSELAYAKFVERLLPIAMQKLSVN